MKKIFLSIIICAIFCSGCVQTPPSEEQIEIAAVYTVTEIGRGVLKTAATLSDTDAQRLWEILMEDAHDTGGMVDCPYDCALNLAGTLIYYHAQSGTFCKLSLAEFSTMSFAEPAESAVLTLGTELHEEMNEILSAYITFADETAQG